jgi:hypothetical protein
MAGTNNTPFSFNSDIVAQHTGTGAPVPGPISPTYAATQAIGGILQYCGFVLIDGVNATSATCTITTTYVARAGAQIAVAVRGGGGTVTATFSTGFKTSATAAATIGTLMTVSFRSNGTNWVESGRSLAIAE